MFTTSLIHCHFRQSLDVGLLLVFSDVLLFISGSFFRVAAFFLQMWITRGIQKQRNVTEKAKCQGKVVIFLVRENL